MTSTPKPCSSNTPPWFIGHWREWHRGHGCSQDDGKRQSDAARTEIEQHAANADTGFLTDAELGFLRAATTSGNMLLVRALDELTSRRSGKTAEALTATEPRFYRSGDTDLCEILEAAVPRRCSTSSGSRPSRWRDRASEEVSVSERPLELHKWPLYGPMVEVYAEQRAALSAELERRRVARDAEQIALERGHVRLLPEPKSAAAVCWRTLAGVSLCDEHTLGLLDYGFVPDDFRPVWEDTKIVEVVAQTGMIEADVRRLHAHYFDERCSMCGVVSRSNRCLSCDEVLHPNWPAVYCSNSCALEDA